MNITKKELEKSQIELTVELSLAEFKPFIEKGVKKVSEEIKIEGFRPGKVPFAVLKQKIGEMTILEEAAQIAVDKTLPKVLAENTDKQVIGQPRVDILKLAPENPLIYKITLSALPEVKLSDYKNAKVKKEKKEVKDEEVKKIMLTPINNEITEREPSNGYLVMQGGIPEVEEFISRNRK